MEDDIYIIAGIIVIIIVLGAFGFYGSKYAKTYINGYIDNMFSSFEKNNTQKPQLVVSSNQEPVFQFVSATEYQIGDTNGSTIIKLADYRGDKINTTCWEKILYPDKSTYIEWSEMIWHSEYSNYYLNFDIPSVVGIYDQEVRCIVNNKNISLGKGFHVSNISNIIQTNIVNDLRDDMMVIVS